MERRLASVDHDSDIRLPRSPGTSPVCIDSAADVVKRGCLYVKKPPTNRGVSLNIKTWQKRHLVLRDSWHQSGATTLEMFDREPQSNAASTAIGGAITDSNSSYVVDLRTVTNVDVHLESRSFQHAFIVQRAGGSPIIFGADEELEMRCWLTSIKLLADKVNHGNDDIEKPRNPSCPPRMGHEVNLILMRQQEQMGLRLNRSTPQLNCVSVGGNLAGISLRTRHDSTATTCSQSPNTSGHSYIDIIDGSLRPTSSSDESQSDHPLRRIFTASFLSNFGSVKEATVVQKKKYFNKDRRKDSGFSDSFDEHSPMIEDQVVPFRLSSTPLPEEDQIPSPLPDQSADSPPIPPPRRASPSQEIPTSPRRQTPTPRSLTFTDDEIPPVSTPVPSQRPASLPERSQSERRPSLPKSEKLFGGSSPPDRDPSSERPIPPERDHTSTAGVPPMPPPRRPERLASPSIRPLPREPPSLSSSPPRPPPRPIHTLPMTCMVKH